MNPEGNLNLGFEISFISCEISLCFCIYSAVTKTSKMLLWRMWKWNTTPFYWSICYRVIFLLLETFLSSLQSDLLVTVSGPPVGMRFENEVLLSILDRNCLKALDVRVLSSTMRLLHKSKADNWGTSDTHHPERRVPGKGGRVTGPLWQQQDFNFESTLWFKALLLPSPNPV